jgi:hypothetical protein
MNKIANILESFLCNGNRLDSFICMVIFNPFDKTKKEAILLSRSTYEETEAQRQCNNCLKSHI